MKTKEKSIKKIICMIIVSALCLQTSVTAFAAENVIKYPDVKTTNEIQPYAISGFNQQSGTTGTINVSTSGTTSWIAHLTVKFLNTNQTGYIQVAKPDGSMFTFDGSGIGTCTPGEHDNNQFVIYNAMPGTYKVSYWNANGTSSLVQCWIY